MCAKEEDVRQVLKHLDADLRCQTQTQSSRDNVPERFGNKTGMDLDNLQEKTCELNRKMETASRLQWIGRQGSDGGGLVTDRS